MQIAILIDDDADDVSMLKDVIVSLDPTITCLAFTDSTKAINFVNDLPDPIHFVFTDYNMPKRNGADIVVAVRKHPCYAETVVAVLSTAVLRSESARLDELGADFIFVKPAEVKDMEIVVRTVLEGRKVLEKDE